MILTNIEFSEFIKDFETTLKQLFREKGDINQLSLERGLPPSIMTEIMSKTPLAVAIPEQYGGRGSIVKECLGLLAAASYESLSLSLIFGINIALFLEPVSKYANEGVKKDIFDRFLKNQNMGGLMITEPDYGSDALNMKTINREVENGYQIKGTKHWQGLTGAADYWLITSRKENSNGELGRDIDFFICDVSQPKQQVVVEEYFDNLGLYMIPYGRNILDLEVPREYKLEPETTGIKMMLDVLHRSRMQFPGMGMGFIKRMLDEAINHCSNRIVGTGNLLSMDQVQFQISRIQSAFTICSAMCARSSEISGIEHNLAAEGLEANSMKAVVTDLMQESSQMLLQLSGANGYKITHIGGRGVMDSRPFQIFEGSNEMLYAQIAEMVTRQMKKQKLSNLFDFLKDFKRTSDACLYFENDLNFNIDNNIPQRKLVDLGKIISRIICAGYVIDLANKGFRADLADNCITSVRQEVSALVCSFKFSNTVNIIEDYTGNSSWMEFV
ncbi:alkylation response protein AidB-like acyl-CoA dehydrogenase [Arcticibacter tournemirensis]|uniref:Acyl-CoA dehydrogenase n=1 Tax=Arcticibacter tournemirensis TaxID=699437 RepID=A0A5M9HIE6_9SPHI|nr:acyl-CoA dehydrogenase family protein [Arcticibacter tournemirensis]KAA8486806.1 acyl-CoA dehydrogenase [Arcticibacter tournemirensis]TQM49351.1 alkylation response protein AidB-like acyl-CoA dehydrogenase [Arcticibacter tournemirensis]